MNQVTHIIVSNVIKNDLLETIKENNIEVDKEKINWILAQLETDLIEKYDGVSLYDAFKMLIEKLDHLKLDELAFAYRNMYRKKYILKE